METVTIDKAGKVYLPKAVRDKIKEKRYSVAVLPDGTIMMHKIKHFSSAKEALKEFQKLPKVTKPIPEIKEEIEKEALKSARK